MKTLYFDSAATTAVYPELNELVAYYNSECYYNPSALYAAAVRPNDAIRDSRKKIANVLGVSPDEIFFTSCATESNNWVLRSVCCRPGAKLVTTAGEHAAVRETAKALSEKGVLVTTAPLLKDGRVDVRVLTDSIEDDTKLVSLIHVSNETGAINDIAAMADIIKSDHPNVLIHSDGVQAFGKIKTSLDSIDFYSISGHKVHAPKGIGALRIKKGLRLTPFMTGGGQEQGRRSGTENVSGIAAFGEAARLFSTEYDSVRVAAYRDRVIEKLGEEESFFVTVPVGAASSPHVLSCGFNGIRGETLMHALSQAGVIVGMGSACSARSVGNVVLQAAGIAKDKIGSAIRISFDMSHSKADIEEFCARTLSTVRSLKEKLK